MKINESWIGTLPIAHRGLHNEEIPENSLSSFKNAIKHKCPIELDITCLADGTPVVFHDEKLSRMTGKDGFITNSSLEEISKINLLGSKEKIPTLAQALETIDGKVPVLLEIKNFSKVGNLEKAVWKILQSYKGEYAVMSFNPYTLEWFKNNAPKVKRGQLASFFKNREISGLRKFSLKRMLFNKKISQPNFIVYQAEDLPNKYVKKYYGVLPVLACSIKSEGDQERLSGFCDNFVFDGYIPTNFKK